MSNNQIVIIDYNMGNLRSVQKAFEKVGCNAIISNKHDMIKNASSLVLPGVGAFKDGMKHLKNLSLISLLTEEVLNKKKPFLGICLGMQLIAKKSYEHGKTKGLGWIDAEVVKFDFIDDDLKLKIPHVGWNNIKIKKPGVLLQEIKDDSDFYFVHSYHFTTKEDIVTTTSEYGIEFISSIQSQNIFACQFHPEKSQMAGLKIIENFIRL